jgi:hypothetical protein
MHAVSQVPEPGLQLRSVVPGHGFLVGVDGRQARHGGPGARGQIQEGHVGFGRVGDEILGFPGVEVGEEDKVDAAVFPHERKTIKLAIFSFGGGADINEGPGEQLKHRDLSLDKWTKHTVLANDMHLEARSSLSEALVVSMPSLMSVMNLARSSTFSFNGGFS